MTAGDGVSRRRFLGLAATAAAVGAACASPKRQEAEKAAPQGRRTLGIAQASHFVPAYDSWFDDEYTKRWGEERGIEVIVDHVTVGSELQAQADAEVAAQRGHDIFGFASPPPALEDQVVDHRELVEEVAAKLGPMTPLVERSILNPRTGKYFGFSDYWVPGPAHFRIDLWDQVEPGLTPDTWNAVVRAGPKLKAMGHPLGIGISQSIDGNFALMALMHAYGSSIQDEEGNVAINRPATVEAVKAGVAVFQGGMTDEVFSWDASSNNRFLASGKGSLILNPVSAIRAVEKQDPELARQIALASLPAGPTGRRGPAVAVGVYVIWRFAKNQEAAKQFLVDLALNYQEAFLRSEFYNLPAFPGALKDLGQLVSSDPTAQPPGKYALLAEATGWSTNVGDPGNANAAVDEVLNQYLVPQMFAAAARGEMSAEDAVRAAEGQITPIFDKWRERGKI